MRWEIMEKNKEREVKKWGARGLAVGSEGEHRAGLGSPGMVP